MYYNYVYSLESFSYLFSLSKATSISNLSTPQPLSHAKDLLSHATLQSSAFYFAAELISDSDSSIFLPLINILCLSLPCVSSPPSLLPFKSKSFSSLQVEMFLLLNFATL